MKPLVLSHTFTLSGVPYICDVLIGLYATSHRPCILLVDAKEFSSGWQESISTATTNPPPGFLEGYSFFCFAFKTWSENEGLLEQLLALKGEDDLPFFVPVRTSNGEADLKISLGFCKAPVFTLRGKALDLYTELLKELAAEEELP